jgi:N6-adenosine-specific RNA methylase IME4
MRKFTPNGICAIFAISVVRKPAELYHRIERYVGGEGPFLELFARQSRPGWMTWGLEKNKFDPPGTSEVT